MYDITQNKLKVGILGATGMVGQRMITLLKNHPWFEVVLVAASGRSSGKPYAEAVKGRWKMDESIPEDVQSLIVQDVQNIKENTKEVDFVFCALDMEKDAIIELENKYASAEIPVVSNNSANRWTDDVPMIIPEVNAHHLDLIEAQKKNRGWNKGCIVIKPNCSIQSYVPTLHALQKFEPEKIFVTTMQAISGSGKKLKECPEVQDNVIPLPGEEIKAEQEPLKIFGKIENDAIELSHLKVSAHCTRVAAEDGHMAVLSVQFKNKPSKEAIIEAWENYHSQISNLDLPSAPSPCLQYLEDDNHPQTKLHRDFQKGMGISIGRLRDCHLLDYRFMCLSHNTIRGAAGGAILTAELMVKKNLIAGINSQE